MKRKAAKSTKSNKEIWLEEQGAGNVVKRQKKVTFAEGNALTRRRSRKATPRA